MRIHLILAILGLATSAVAAPANVEPQIWKNLESDKTTDVLVTFKKGETKVILDNFKSLRISSRSEKLNTMHRMLKSHADAIQTNVIAMLAESNFVLKRNVRQLWSSCTLIVHKATRKVIEQLRSHPDVKSLIADRVFPLIKPVDVARDLSPSDIVNQQAWGVNHIGASKAWSHSKGAGTVVAVMDTGALSTQEAVNPTYRGTKTGSHDFNWYDAVANSPEPIDEHGHGTHCTGTIAGCEDSGIGVAPESTWIACRVCGESGCNLFDIVYGYDWMLCPYNATTYDCSKAPHVSSNSWGGTYNSQIDSIFDQVFGACTAQNIIVVFANGNEGSGCATTSWPGARKDVISAGALDRDDVIGWFSSRGPSPATGLMKPDISAPGLYIKSASITSNSSYIEMSGTSMACPHIAGVVALMKSLNPSANLTEILNCLCAGAQKATTAVDTCGPKTFPNNDGGWGVVTAPASCECIMIV